MTADVGRDTSCTTSMRTGRFVTRARLIAEALYRRLTTPRGMLRGGEEEKNYGKDLTEMVGSATTESDRVALPGQVRAEALKDERILSVDLEVVVTRVGPETSFQITIKAKTSAGPFTLALRASSVTTELLGITAEAA